MTRFEKAMKLSEVDFKQVIGVNKETFAEMSKVLRLAYAQKHKRRGRHTILSNEDKLFLALKYWRQYVTQKELVFEFEVSETTAKDTIFWVEDVLIACGKFSLPSKKALLCEDNKIEVVLVDATETSIERPKKDSVSGIKDVVMKPALNDLYAPCLLKRFSVFNFMKLILHDKLVDERNRIHCEENSNFFYGTYHNDDSCYLRRANRHHTGHGIGT